MARYPIIMRDQTYSILLQMAADRGLTLGKYLNMELENLAKNNVGVKAGQVKAKIDKPCFLCKHESTQVLENIASGLKKDFCPICSENALASHKWRVDA